jgi:hypothetical protein
MARDKQTEDSLKTLLGQSEPSDFAARFAGVRPGAVPSTPIVWPSDQHVPNQIQQVKANAPAQVPFAIPTNQPGRPVVAPRTTPGMVKNVRVITRQVTTPDGQTKKQVTVAFTHPPNDPYFAGANIYLHKSGAEPVLVASGAKSPLQFVTDASSVPHAVHVTSVGNQGETDVMKSPAAPLSLQVTKSGGGVSSSSSASSSATGNLLQVNPTQTDPVTGAPIIQPVPPVKVIGGFPPSTKVSLDNLSDGGTTGRTKQSELVNNTVMRVNDGTNIRTASQITGVVHSTSGAGAGVIDNAAVIHSRPEGIGTTVQKLNSSGLLLDADQVAADGTNYLRSPQFSGSAIAVENPNFVLGVAGYSATAGAITQDTASPFTNGKSLKHTTTVQDSDVIGTRLFKVTPGDVFYFSIYAKSDGVYNGFGSLVWKDGSQNFLSESDLSYGTSTSWAQYTFTATAPANAAYVEVVILARGDAGGLSQSAWVTDVHLVRTASLDNEVANGTNYIRTPQYAGSAIVVENSNFVAGTAGWGSANATLSQVPNSPFTNGKALQVSTAAQFAGAQSNRHYKVTPGDQFFISGYVNSDGIFEAKIQVTYFDGSGAFLGSDGAISIATSWTQISGTGTAPANTAYITIDLVRVDATGGTHICWFTDIHVVRTASLDNEVADGPTFVRIGNVNADHTFHVSTSLNNQAVLTGSPAASVSYTSTTSSIQWSWGAFTLYFSDGSTVSVASGSQNFTGLASATTYFFEFYVVKATATMTCVKSDNSTAPASTQFLAQTVGADGHAIEVTDITAATTSSGTGGGSGGGGTCFSGDVKVKTPQGFVRMDELPEKCVIINLTGEHEAEVIVHRNALEPMRVMSGGGLVTNSHLLREPDGAWLAASSLFSEKAPQTPRTLYNIHVITQRPENMHYILENGYIAHNKKRVSCFSGDAQILTARGWQRLDKLPSTFTVKNSDGIFPARLVKHEDCSQSVYELPDGSTVTADHFIRRSGQTGWTLAHEVLPASSKSPSTLFNVIVEGSDHFALSNGYEANDMEGNS